LVYAGAPTLEEVDDEADESADVPKAATPVPASSPGEVPVGGTTTPTADAAKDRLRLLKISFL
jgi:hypothetical protein